MNSRHGSGTPPWLYHAGPTTTARAWPKPSPRLLKDFRWPSAPFGVSPSSRWLLVNGFGGRRGWRLLIPRSNASMKEEPNRLENRVGWRRGRTASKIGWLDRYGPTDLGPFRPGPPPPSSTWLLSLMGPFAPLLVGFSCHYPRDQDKGTCRMNSDTLLSRSSGISCSCISVLTTFAHKFILHSHTNGASWSSC
jgi:hypothetical protein